MNKTKQSKEKEILEIEYLKTQSCHMPDSLRRKRAKKKEGEEPEVEFIKKMTNASER